MRTLMRWALTPLAVVALAGCGGDDEKAGSGKAGPAEPSGRTLAATLKQGGDFATLDGVLSNAGLTAVLEGKGPYTVFAPRDAAFTAAGAGADFTDPTRRAQGAALLRAHIVPGAVTRGDIAAALQGAENGKVEMRTMADTLLTFSRDGQTVMVTAEDGAHAYLAGEESVASNGVIQPVDSLLVAPGAPGE